jgi:hypothetical protein
MTVDSAKEAAANTAADTASPLMTTRCCFLIFMIASVSVEEF